MNDAPSERKRKSQKGLDPSPCILAPDSLVCDKASVDCRYYSERHGKMHREQLTGSKGRFIHAIGSAEHEVVAWGDHKWATDNRSLGKTISLCGNEECKRWSCKTSDMLLPENARKLIPATAITTEWNWENGGGEEWAYFVAVSYLSSNLGSL